MLVFAVLPTNAVIHHAVSLVLYAGCILLMWKITRQMRLDRWSTFLAISSFFHPAFLWSVTWISQRNSVLALFLLLGAISATRVPAKLTWIALCSGAKTPYIFQNIVFSFQFLQRRHIVAAVIPLVLMLVFGVSGYLTYYVQSVGENTLAHPAVPLPVAVALRTAKLIEGIVYVFAPFPMFAIGGWWPIVALIAYVILWTVVFRSLRTSSFEDGGNAALAAIAATMTLPFVFASEVRVVGEAAVIAYLAIAAGGPVERFRKDRDSGDPDAQPRWSRSELRDLPFGRARRLGRGDSG
jgi:hypothetical protein